MVCTEAPEECQPMNATQPSRTLCRRRIIIHRLTSERSGGRPLRDQGTKALILFVWLFIVQLPKKLIKRAYTEGEGPAEHPRTIDVLHLPLGAG